MRMQRRGQQSGMSRVGAKFEAIETIRGSGIAAARHKWPIGWLAMDAELGDCEQANGGPLAACSLTRPHHWAAEHSLAMRPAESGLHASRCTSGRTLDACLSQSNK